tara:strand:- start:1931 stop:2734 length:804 start_codon:yes stop_codon:yes gene_type:complete
MPNLNSKYYFQNLTQPEIADHFKLNPLIILPTGSTEQHGAHLPSGTDIFASNIIAEQVAEKMKGIVLPGGDLGVTPMHMPYEATLSLSPNTYMNYIFDLCESAAQHGAKKLIIINWHEGNIPSLSIVSDKLHREVGLSVLIVQACYVADEMFGSLYGGLTHGGEIETLAVLAYNENLVDLNKISNSSEKNKGEKMDALRRTRSFQPVLTDIRTIAPSGWYGDPTKATVEKGKEMVKTLSNKIAKVSEEILDTLEKTQGKPKKIKTLK